MHDRVKEKINEFVETLHQHFFKLKTFYFTNCLKN